ncbi:rCG54762, partial [Rattus norvegicus]
MRDLFQFPQVLSQFIHRCMLEGQSELSAHPLVHSFSVAKRVCVEGKKKLVPIDCQTFLQY